MISRKFIIWACGLLFVFSSCAEDMVKPIENDKDAPGTVQDVKTESLPGAVKFTYTLPSDPDLLYVLAKYTNKTGKVMEFPFLVLHELRYGRGVWRYGYL